MIPFFTETLFVFKRQNPLLYHDVKSLDKKRPLCDKCLGLLLNMIVMRLACSLKSHSTPIIERCQTCVCRRENPLKRVTWRLNISYGLLTQRDMLLNQKMTADGQHTMQIKSLQPSDKTGIRK